MIGDAADVDRRNGEAANFAATHRLVEGLDRGRHDAHAHAGPADQPACRPERFEVGAENGRRHEIVDQSRLQASCIEDLDVVVGRFQNAGDSLFQRGG